MTELEMLRAAVARHDAEIIALREQVSRLGGRKARPTDVELMTAITASPSGGVSFSAFELWQHAETIGGPLAATIAACGFRNHKALGRRLGKIVDANVTLEGRRLVRAGRDAGGWIWELHEQSDAVTLQRHSQRAQPSIACGN